MNVQIKKKKNPDKISVPLWVHTIHNAPVPVPYISSLSALGVSKGDTLHIKRN